MNRLEKKIEITREEMVFTANRDGLTAEQTVKLSKELDSLINQYETRKISLSIKNNEIERKLLN